MTFNDDDPIVLQDDSSSDDGDDATPFDEGDITAIIINKMTAPLVANEFNVMVELTGSNISSDRLPVDLVLVLDISSSMYGDKIQRLKTATEFVIQKLGPMDRVSLVTFEHTAHRLCPLRQITHKSRPEILRLLEAIHPRGSTNITDGLKTGLQVLSDRRFTDGRVEAIMLMSDGEQNDGPDAGRIKSSDLPVYTFGFGTDHEPKVLKAIAENSDGGTFSDVQDVEHLSYAFAQCLAGLLVVAVQNLTLTVSTKELDSKIKAVLAGNYNQSKEGDSATTISFFNLYNQEKRKVVVTLSLPAVKCEQPERVLKVSYTYGNDEEAAPLFADITRTARSVELEKEAVVMEMCRVSFVKKFKEARILADGNHMADARTKLVEARNVLEQSKYPNNPVIKELKQEHEHLAELMASTQIYKAKGHSFALSFETSHDRQRFALRGDAEKHRMFATPRMGAHLEQVKSFQKHPNSALPTAEEDWEKERAAMLAQRRNKQSF